MPKGNKGKLNVKPPPGFKPGKGPRGAEKLGTVQGEVIKTPKYRPTRTSSPEPPDPWPSSSATPPSSSSSSSTSPGTWAPGGPDESGPYIPMAEGGTIIGEIENMGTELQEGIDFLDGLLDAIYHPAWDVGPLASIPGLGPDSDPRR